GPHVLHPAPTPNLCRSGRKRLRQPRRTGALHLPIGGLGRGARPGGRSGRAALRPPSARAGGDAARPPVPAPRPRHPRAGRGLAPCPRGGASGRRRRAPARRDLAHGGLRDVRPPRPLPPRQPGGHRHRHRGFGRIPRTSPHRGGARRRRHGDGDAQEPRGADGGDHRGLALPALAAVGASAGRAGRHRPVGPRGRAPHHAHGGRDGGGNREPLIGLKPAPPGGLPHPERGGGTIPCGDGGGCRAPARSHLPPLVAGGRPDREPGRVGRPAGRAGGHRLAARRAPLPRRARVHRPIPSHAQPV
ncbi:MAG: Transcriptional regulator, LysR family, partial [uncultured Rubellimicrobium sp.]